MKGILKGSLQGIALALCIFGIVCLVYDIVLGGKFSLEDYQMTKMIIGSIIAGIGYGAPSVVYNNDRMSYATKILVHMGIGCVVYTIVAFNVGWLGNNTTLGLKILIVGCQIALAFAIWFGFRLYYKHEAKKMNEKIHSMR
ncbi:MAG: DUF3021 domain-containing protein [Lachnospiraceae bacterium]|nr:DUF3021 domain-containing protein [Lachnospiraceae bacterium]